MMLAEIRAVITGGVSGLGFATARHIVAQGGKVVLLDINDAKAPEALQTLVAGNAAYFKTDVSDEAEVAAQIRHAAASSAGRMPPSTALASSVQAGCSAAKPACRWPSSALPSRSI